jgi:hypothetical protein
MKSDDHLGRALDPDAHALRVRLVELAGDDDAAARLAPEPALPVPERRRRRDAHRAVLGVRREHRLHRHRVGHAFADDDDVGAQRAVGVAVAVGRPGLRIGEAGVGQPAAAVVVVIARRHERPELHRRHAAGLGAAQRGRDHVGAGLETVGDPALQPLGEQAHLAARYRYESRVDQVRSLWRKSPHRRQPPGGRIRARIRHGAEEGIPQDLDIPSASRDGRAWPLGPRRPRSSLEIPVPLHHFADGHPEEHSREITSDSVLAGLEVRPVAARGVDHAVGVVPLPVEAIEPDSFALALHALRRRPLKDCAFDSSTVVRGLPFDPRHRGKVPHRKPGGQGLRRGKMSW